MLLNRDRADAIMDREGLDGLVATSAINIYYLSDYMGPLMKMRRTFYNYALLPRRHDAPATLVLTGVEQLRLFHKRDATWMPKLRQYLHPVYQDRRDFDPDVEDPEAVEYGMRWPIRHDSLSPRDEAYVRFIEEGRGDASVNATYALKRAIEDAGLARARLGSDDPRIDGWLNGLGLDALHIRDATTLFREIRMVKTPDEIALMRTAAQINEAALEAVIASLVPGMMRTELEAIFNVEVARRGGKAVFLSTGQGGTNANLGTVLEHEPITFDAFSEFAGYHGDVGRVAVCGTPRPDLLDRMRAIAIGCDVVRDTVKPGVTGRELSERVIEAVRGAGFAGFFFATPHSLGLEHSDHPLPIGPVLPGGHGEFVFEENMIFTVDMPYYEVGWGNLHMEDQFLVTADGVEPLTSCDTSLRIRPGR